MYSDYLADQGSDNLFGFIERQWTTNQRTDKKAVVSLTVFWASLFWQDYIRDIFSNNLSLGSSRSWREFGGIKTCIKPKLCVTLSYKMFTLQILWHSYISPHAPYVYKIEHFSLWPLIRYRIYLNTSNWVQKKNK